MSGDQSAYSWTEAEKDLMEGIDTTVPHSARIWNYWLGGKDNYPVDRAAGDQFLKAYPGMAAEARANRQFLARGVGYLVTEAGVRQFLDIGTGLPTADNTHEIAQRLNPACRIVYVDNDPLVLAHARALLTSTPEGVTDYVDADLHDPDKILNAAAKILDFSAPIALILSGIMGHIADGEGPHAIVSQLMDRPARRQLPDAPGRHHGQPGQRRRAGGLQRERRDPLQPAHPGGDRPVLRRPGTGGARRPADPGVAARRLAPPSRSRT